jgi:hypothetical protein
MKRPPLTGRMRDEIDKEKVTDGTVVIRPIRSSDPAGALAPII